MSKLISHSAFWLLSVFGIGLNSCAQDEKVNEPQEATTNIKKEINMENKMKVEIWSDVMCPFCYIGKRNFETALEQFEHKNELEVVWKSYQLDSRIPEAPKDSYQDYLVKNKGMSQEQVKGMLDNVTLSAKQVGLEYNFDKAVMVNSLNAHKFIQFAKTKGLGDQAEEKLFLAFFTEGKNIADIDTLVQIGKELELGEADVKAALNDEKYASLFNQDIQEA